MAWGVTAIRKVRTQPHQPHRGPAMHPHLVRAQQRQSHDEGHEIIDGAIGHQAPSSRSWGTAGNSSSRTASNTPMPPGTLLITPAAMAIK